MPKLYYTTTSCGAASFIAAFKGEVKMEAETADIRTKKTASGADFLKINSKGNVPTIVLDNGMVLNENVATLSYITAQAGGKVGPSDTSSPEFFAYVSVLAYLASEFHTSIGPFFNPALTEEQRAAATAKINMKLKYINDEMLAGKEYVFGDSFTAADSYLYIMLSWGPYVKLEWTAYPNVQAFFDRISKLEFVQAAHARIATNPDTTF